MVCTCSGNHRPEAQTHLWTGSLGRAAGHARDSSQDKDTKMEAARGPDGFSKHEPPIVRRLIGVIWGLGFGVSQH